jgi:aspartate carbamoyltransferase regulatory subunit
MTPKERKEKIGATKIFAIKAGTVIDHIPDGKGLALVSLLKLSDSENPLAIGLNLKSRRHGRKDLVKVEGKELTPNEVNQVAVLVPTATINIIRDFRVYKKFTVQMPEIIEGWLKCPNPKCITNNERMLSKFHPIAEKKHHYGFKCHYCERIFPASEVIY